ncbi:MAG: class II aldolase/adducin family protein [Ferrimicrobium sp.]|uniref:class II aldolase/adducin family protein n=1 Tax=Ferrimicrobium sp. TaxID=2926050 RepID=UPI002606DDF0|nr:class II aldolase/adducin family protein [Ferrimicrobium sp.]
MTQQAESIVRAAKILFENGVMSHTGHANLSARLGDDSMLLTIDGQVRNLTADRVATVGLDGVVREGDLDPTNAEIIAMHSEIYKLRSDVGGIIHTHSPSLLAFAMANQALPCRYEALLRWGQSVDVPVAAWAPRGSDKSVSAIIDQAKAHPETKAVILGNHGVLVFASDPVATAQLLTVLEEAAEAELAAIELGGAQSLPESALAAIRESMARVR